VKHGRSTVNLDRGRAKKRYSIIFFLWSEGVKPEIYSRMKVRYGDSCLSQGRVYGWVERFQNGRQKLPDDNEVMESVQIWLKATQKNIFSRGHPQGCGEGDQLCCEAGGLCRKTRHKQFLEVFL
jgi:hypothetical protein